MINSLKRAERFFSDCFFIFHNNIRKVPAEKIKAKEINNDKKPMRYQMINRIIKNKSGQNNLRK